jgi:hypothetical protein
MVHLHYLLSKMFVLCSVVYVVHFHSSICSRDFLNQTLEVIDKSLSLPEIVMLLLTSLGILMGKS